MRGDREIQSGVCSKGERNVAQNTTRRLTLNRFAFSGERRGIVYRAVSRLLRASGYWRESERVVARQSALQGAVSAGPQAVPAGEGGFTLVEVLIGMLIMGATLVPLSNVFTGGVSAAAFAARQSDAVALASGALSKAQSVSYADVGFYASQISQAEASYPWYMPDQGGGSYVYLGSKPSSGYNPLLVPVRTSTVGTGSYDVATVIVWANAEVPAASGGIATDYQAYKQVSVTVRWYRADRLSGSVTESTIVYPGAQSQYSGPGGASASGSGSGGGQPGTPTIPSTLDATTATGTAGSSEVDVTWSGGSVPGSSTTSGSGSSSGAGQSGYYVVEWSTNLDGLPAAYASGTGGLPASSGVAASPHQLATASSYQVGGLAPGTTYYMEVIAFGAGGQSWSTSGIVQATTKESTSAETSTGTGNGSSSSNGTGTGTSAGSGSSSSGSMPTGSNGSNCNQSSSVSCNGNGNGDSGPSDPSDQNGGCSVISLTVTGASSANTGKTYLTPNGLMSENLDLSVSLTGCQDDAIEVSASPVDSSTSDPGSPYVLSLQAAGHANGTPGSAASQGAQVAGTVYSAGQSGWVTGQHLFNVVYDNHSAGVSASMIVCPWMPPSQRSSSQSEC
ncbi:MAG: type IV pilus modification PilV family protein [Acidimicrobiales bacterium]